MQAPARVTRSTAAASNGEALAATAELGDVVCAAAKDGPTPYLVGVVAAKAELAKENSSSIETGNVKEGTLALVVTKLEPVTVGSMTMEVTDRQLIVPASSIRVVKMEATVAEANRAAINQLEGVSTAAKQSTGDVRYKERDRVTFSNDTRAQMWQYIAQ